MLSVARGSKTYVSNNNFLIFDSFVTLFLANIVFLELLSLNTMKLLKKTTPQMFIQIFIQIFDTVDG